MEKLTDESLMPNGQYEGFKMKDVPAGYLLYVYLTAFTPHEVDFYIKENLSEIKKRNRREKWEPHQ